MRTPTLNDIRAAVSTEKETVDVATLGKIISVATFMKKKSL
jgi:hypothetical protein